MRDAPWDADCSLLIRTRGGDDISRDATRPRRRSVAGIFVAAVAARAASSTAVFSGGSVGSRALPVGRRAVNVAAAGADVNSGTRNVLPRASAFGGAASSASPAYVSCSIGDTSCFAHGRAGGARAPSPVSLAASSRTTETRRGPGDASAARVDWPRKADRPNLNNTFWGDAAPLPFLLRGTVSESLRGIVETATDKAAIVRFYWDTVSADLHVPDSLRPEPQQSPLWGVVDEDALASAFDLAPQAEASHDSSREVPLRVGQHVCARIKGAFAADAAVSTVGDALGPNIGPLLSLELTPEQPIEPFVQPTSEAHNSPDGRLWGDFLRRHRLRVVFTSGLPPSNLASEASQDTWEAKFTRFLLHRDEESPTAPPEVEAAWTVLSSGQDAVVSTPMLAAERALLYALPVFKHVRRLPPPMRGSPPRVVVIASSIVGSGVFRVLHRAGVSVLEAGPLLSRGRPTDIACDVVIGQASAIRKAAQSGALDLSRISFVAVDDLLHQCLAEEDKANRQREALSDVLKLLPNHRFGQSLVWAHSLEDASTPVVEAFTVAPAVLFGGVNIFGASVSHELLDEAEVADRVRFYVQQYARLRVLVFAEAPEALAEQLALSDPGKRLQASPDALDVVTVVSNEVSWRQGGIFDVLIHVDAPPNLGEYRRRLASCSQLAVAMVTKQATSRRLSRGWLEFVRYEQHLVRPGPTQRLLRGLASSKKDQEIRAEKPRLPNLDHTPQRHKRHPKKGEAKGTAHDDFYEDFSTDASGSLVWAAGVDEENTEVAFLNGI